MRVFQGLIKIHAQKCMPQKTCSAGQKMHAVKTYSAGQYPASDPETLKSLQVATLNQAKYRCNTIR